MAARVKGAVEEGVLARKQTGDAQNSVAVIVKSNQLLLINKSILFVVLSYKIVFENPIHKKIIGFIFALKNFAIDFLCEAKI